MPVTRPLQFSPQFVAVEAFVSDEQHGAGFGLEQVHDVRSLVSLPGDQFHMQSLSAQIGDNHQFGVSSASRPAHRLSLRSSRWIGGALVRHHMRAVHQSDRAAPGASHFPQHALPQSGPRPVAVIAEDGLPRAEFARQIPTWPGVAQPVKQGLHYKVG
jgi:hypothetical protein